MSRKRPNKPFQSPPLDTLVIPETTVEPFSQEAKGFTLLIFASVSLLSTLSFAYAAHNTNWFGSIGHFIGKIWFGIFGLGAYPIFVLIGWVGWRYLFLKPLGNVKKRILHALLAILAVDLILCVVEDNLPELRAWLGEVLTPQMWQKRLRFHLGGAPLYYIYHDLPKINLLSLFNTLGVSIMALAMLGTGLLYLCKSSPRQLAYYLTDVYSRLMTWTKAKFAPTPEEPAQQSPSPLQPASLPVPALRSFNRTVEEDTITSTMTPAKLAAKKRPQRMLMAIPPPVEIADNDVLETESAELSPEERRQEALRAQAVFNGNFTEYTLPSAELLTPAKPIDSAQLDEILRQQADILEDTLMNFGIVAKVGNINCGPTITSFEVHPSVGVKVQRIKALENDIALNLEAKSIRIIAPIPGKAAVGIEIPSPFPQEVSFQELLVAYQKGSKRFNIPLLLGKAVNGDFVMSDLAKMPHLIIAGATGSGKSVCINTIVMSIVLNAKPDEIRLLMVDPKKVELTAYSPLPHMLAPVITEPGGACAALQWLVKEMENRYDLLKQLGLRNIDSFNNRTRDLEKEEALNRDVPERLFYIVGIIDELADLMMVSSNDIETYIARIAQMARAVGIHLILATQRPSREVITGLIKANFPTRISFKVASRVNSQIILDEVGAETLMGNGDMLFLPPGTSNLMRAQGAYIRDEDINRVVKKICDQAPPNYIIASFDHGSFILEGLEDEDEDGPKDSMYEQAKDVILGTGNASTTFLQRKLKIGYARAASIMDQLERQGVVGPAEGSRPRKILARGKRGSDVAGIEDEVEMEEELMEDER